MNVFGTHMADISMQCSSSLQISVFQECQFFVRNYLRDSFVFVFQLAIYHFVLTSITFLKVSCFKRSVTVNMKYLFEFLLE